MTTAEKEYRLKLEEDPAGLPNGHKVEVEVEGLEGSKVLLLKVNDKLRVLSPRCTRMYQVQPPPTSLLIYWVIANCFGVDCGWQIMGLRW